MPRKPQLVDKTVAPASQNCRRFNESTSPIRGAGKRSVECESLPWKESVLVVATLVSATVVVLWGVKINTALDQQNACVEQKPPKRHVAQASFRGGGSLLLDGR